MSGFEPLPLPTALASRAVARIGPVTSTLGKDSNRRAKKPDGEGE